MMNKQIYCPECGGKSPYKKYKYDKYIFDSFYCPKCDHYFSINILGRTREKIMDLEWDNAGRD